jgi:hypothetical protein
MGISPIITQRDGRGMARRVFQARLFLSDIAQARLSHYHWQRRRRRLDEWDRRTRRLEADGG